MSKEGGNFGPTLVSHGIISLACRPESVAFDSRRKRLIGISIKLINGSVIFVVFVVSVVRIIIVIPVVSTTVVAATATAAVASITLQSTCFF